MRITSGGNVGIGTTGPGTLLEVAQPNPKFPTSLWQISAFDSTSAGIGVGGGLSLSGYKTGQSAKEVFAAIDGYKENSTDGDAAGAFRISTQPSSGQGLQEWVRVTSSGNVGIGTTSPQAKLHVSGEILTKAVNITAGADIAEPFPVAGPDIPKGAVVVIDDTQPGQLKLSDRAYDTRVAGIVSGANGVNSGLTLRQEGALDGNHNVALTGRVYALADASTSPIQPGDMLTTSDTPGHVMKAADRAKAYGAVIGKAMTPLKEGQGLVLVLVGLQ